MTPNARFLKFIKDINPSKTATKNASGAHKKVRSVLRQDATYSTYILDDFLGGSYARGTSIRPRTKNGNTDIPDIDVYIVVSGSTWSDSEEKLEDLYAALNRNRSEIGISRLRRNKRSVNIRTNIADIDVTPLLDRQADGKYQVGNRDTGGWDPTDPKKHVEWSANTNQSLNGKMNPAAKLLKWARREKPTKSAKPKGLPLEIFVADGLPVSENNYGKMMNLIFADFVERYENHRFWGSCPHIEDPAVAGNNLLNGVSGDEFAAYYDKLKTHLQDSNIALETDDDEEATSRWRKIFGDRFPSGSTKQTSSLLGATSLVNSATFPDQPVRPRNRPQGFA